MPLKAVIFDFDGVLVNSEPLHFRAMRDALLPEGVTITNEEYENHYLAYDDREAMRVALEIHKKPAGRDDVDRTARRKAEIFETILPEVPFYDGARDLIADLARMVPLAIASGALSDEIETILRTGGLRESFVAVVGADHTPQSKPHPAPYLLAMERLRPRVPDLTATECLVVEDSMAGIASGLAAGMRVLGVAHTYPAAKLSAAHHVVPALRGQTAASLRGLFE
jgi:HAD superfamily hydrolase (TIGR01509 family)